MTNEPPECSTCGSDYILPDPGEPYESGNCDKCEIEMLRADLRKSALQVQELQKDLATALDDHNKCCEEYDKELEAANRLNGELQEKFGHMEKQWSDEYQKARDAEREVREMRELTDKRAKMFFDLENELQQSSRLRGEALVSIEGAWKHLDYAYVIVKGMYTGENLRLEIKEAWKCVRAAKESLTERPNHEPGKYPLVPGTLCNCNDPGELAPCHEHGYTRVKRVDAVQKERCNVCGGHGVVGTRVNALTSRQDPCPKCVGGCVCTNPDDPAKTCLYHQKGD